MKACVRTDNMSGTVLGKDLVSAKYKVSTTETAIENGNIVVIGGLLDGEREVRLASTPAVNSAFDTLALVASEEIVKDKQYNSLGDFENKAGDIIRCYRLRKGDIFSVTAEALSGTLTNAVGKIVEAQADTKMKVVASLTEGSTQIGKIIAVEGNWYVIEVA